MEEMKNTEPMAEEKTEKSERSYHAFPCKSCGNRMIFSPADAALLCPYCKKTEAIASDVVEAAEYLYDPTADTATAPQWEAEGQITNVCSACGAEVVTDGDDMTITCPFCGNHYVSEPHPSLPILRPETLVPHKLSREEADRRFATWVKRRYFAPRAFRKSTHKTEMQGVYLPYFTFDTDLYTSYAGWGGRRRTVSYTVRVNGKTQTRTKTVTDWYPVSGDRREYFDDTPLCASSHVDEKLLGKIGPFSTKNLNVYNPAYLAGFFAERYTIGLADGYRRVRPRVEAQMQSNIEGALGYDTYRGMRYDHQAQRVSFKHILLPVWLSSYRYADKVYSFMVNGESGRVAGKAPISFWKVFFTSLAVLCALVAIFALIVTFGEGSAALAIPSLPELSAPELTAPTAELAEAAALLGEVSAPPDLAL